MLFNELARITPIERWPTPEVSAVEVDDENAVLADFIQMNSAIALSERSRVALRDLIESAGEVLPLRHRLQQLWVYHVLAVNDVFHREKSEYEVFASSGRVKAISRFVMHGGEIADGVQVFRPKGVEWAGIIVSESFKDRVETLGLSGCIFVPIELVDV